MKSPLPLVAVGVTFLLAAGVQSTPTTPGSAAGFQSQEQSAVLHVVQDSTERLGTTSEVLLAKLGTTFVLKRPRTFRVYSQLSFTSPDLGTGSIRTVRLKLNGTTIATATKRSSGSEYPITLYRILRLSPGQYSLAVAVKDSWEETRVLGTVSGDELTYLDAELQ
jgi:hypothetical protein